MATIENRSTYQVTVKNRPDLTAKFPFSGLADVESHMADAMRSPTASDQQPLDWGLPLLDDRRE